MFLSFLFFTKKTCFNFLTAFRYYSPPCVSSASFLSIVCVYVCIPTACRLQLLFFSLPPSLFLLDEKTPAVRFFSVSFFYYFKYSAPPPPPPSFLLVACDCVYFGGVVAFTSLSLPHERKTNYSKVLSSLGLCSCSDALFCAPLSLSPLQQILFLSLCVLCLMSLQSVCVSVSFFYSLPPASLRIVLHCILSSRPQNYHFTLRHCSSSLSLSLSLSLPLLAAVHYFLHT